MPKRAPSRLAAGVADTRPEVHEAARSVSGDLRGSPSGRTRVISRGDVHDASGPALDPAPFPLPEPPERTPLRRDDDQVRARAISLFRDGSCHGTIADHAVIGRRIRSEHVPSIPELVSGELAHDPVPIHRSCIAASRAFRLGHRRDDHRESSASGSGELRRLLDCGTTARRRLVEHDDVCGRTNEHAPSVPGAEQRPSPAAL